MSSREGDGDNRLRTIRMTRAEGEESEREREVGWRGMEIEYG
jgi:hypothetical protein